jgi:hypothetical protein
MRHVWSGEFFTQIADISRKGLGQSLSELEHGFCVDVSL